jgi:hypothetical protein
MQFCRKCNRSSEFTPKAVQTIFPFYESDVTKIETVEFYLPVTIKTGFITSLCSDAFESQRHVLGQVF